MKARRAPLSYRQWQRRERWLGAFIVLSAAIGGGLLYLLVMVLADALLR